MISDHHNGPLLGHPGRDKTIELIQQRYQFPNMRRAVEDYIQQYFKTKTRTRKGPKKMISNHHNGPLLGHPGRDKTIELIQQRYQFLNIRKAVEDYI